MKDNDVGVWLSNIEADCVSAPSDQTNIKVVNNTISSAAATNGIPYSAGVSDQGNNDKIINNTISGSGILIAVDADPLFTNRPKVHANQ